MVTEIMVDNSVITISSDEDDDDDDDDDVCVVLASRPPKSQFSRPCPIQNGRRVAPQEAATIVVADDDDNDLPVMTFLKAGDGSQPYQKGTVLHLPMKKLFPIPKSSDGMDSPAVSPSLCGKESAVYKTPDVRHFSDALGPAARNESAAASCPGLTETLLAEHHHPPAASGYQQQMPCGRQQVARVKQEPLGLWDKLLKPEPPSNVCITPASASSLEGSYTASLPRDDDSPASASSESDASLHCTSLGDVMELLRPPSCVRPLPPSSGQLLSSPMLLDTLDMYLTKKEDSILSYTMEALAVLSGGASLDDNARRKLASFICCAEIHELLRHIIAGVLWRVMALDADSVSTLDWWLEAFEEFFRSPEQALASEACQEVLELTVLALEYHAQATPYKTRHPFCPLTFGNRVARVVECLVKRSRWPIEKLLMRLLDLAVDQYGAYSNRNTQQCLHHVAYLVVDFCRPLTSQARLNLVARLPSRLALRVARLLLEKDPCSLSSTDPVFRLLENYCKVFSPSLCTKDEPIEDEIVGLVVIVLQQLLQAGLMLTDNVVRWLNQLAVVCPDYKVELSVLVSTHSWLREPP